MKIPFARTFAPGDPRGAKGGRRPESITTEMTNSDTPLQRQRFKPWVMPEAPPTDHEGPFVHEGDLNEHRMYMALRARGGLPIDPAQGIEVSAPDKPETKNEARRKPTRDRPADRKAG